MTKEILDLVFFNAAQEESVFEIPEGYVNVEDESLALRVATL